MSEPCRYLPWDSDFFGVRIAQVEANHLDQESLIEIIQWCNQSDIECLYYLADPIYIEAIRTAEDNQFHLVDVRVTRQYQFQPTVDFNQPVAPYLIRPFHVSDLPDLRKIARKSFTRSRFYSDPCFPQDKCDELYDVWIKNSCEGYADHVLVAEIKGLPQGFITCHVRQNRFEGDIGLVGVSEQARGKGVGKSLIEFAREWFYNQGVNRIFVVTQGANILAHKLYDRNGFSIYSIKLWYHKWFKGCLQKSHE